MKRSIPIALIVMILCIAFLGGCNQGNDNGTNGSDAASSNAAMPQGNEHANAGSDASESGQTERSSMRPSLSTVTLSVSGQQFTIDLEDNSTAAAFANMLPLQEEMSDLNGNEKYIFLNEPLPSNASNPGIIEAGDVMLYQDNCIVVFYESHSTTYSCTRIGKITDVSGLATVVGSGSVQMLFCRP